jgi:DNA-binding transcriptional regulator LsrR (DeoR family)
MLLDIYRLSAFLQRAPWMGTCRRRQQERIETCDEPALKRASLHMGKNRNKTDTSPDRTVKLTQVARLYYEENLSQQDIADRLGVSRSLIAQYLQRARESGIVRIEVVDRADVCEDLSTTLEKKSDVERVVVVPHVHGSDDLTLRAVASAAASFLDQHLKDDDVFGLACGKTMSAVVNLLSTAVPRRVEVVPLLGESGHPVLYSQMNHMALQAAQSLGATPYPLLAPLYVSTPKLRAMLLQEPKVRIVTDRWERMSCACAGIGANPPPPGSIPYIGMERVPGLKAAGAVGELCCTYFDRQGDIIDTGVEELTIKVAARHFRQANVVVGVAQGIHKATAVLGAVRTGLLSALFVDQLIAERVLEELG